MSITSIIVSNASRVEQMYYMILSSFGSFQQINLLRSLPEKDGDQPLNDIERVEFSAVSFAYHGVENQIINDMSFTLEKGDCVRVDAPNGSGKSTIFKLLQGLYTPNSGEVRFNGRSIKEYSQDSINKEVLYIGQNAGFVNDTVAKHFKLFTGKNLEKCVELSSLKLLEAINPSKKMERDGRNLSFGHLYSMEKTQR